MFGFNSVNQEQIWLRLWGWVEDPVAFSTVNYGWNEDREFATRLHVPQIRCGTDIHQTDDATAGFWVDRKWHSLVIVDRVDSKWHSTSRKCDWICSDWKNGRLNLQLFEEVIIRNFPDWTFPELLQIQSECPITEHWKTVWNVWEK